MIKIALLMTVLLVLVVFVLSKRRESSVGIIENITEGFTKEPKMTQAGGAIHYMVGITDKNFETKCLNTCLYDPNCTRVVKGKNECWLQTSAAQPKQANDNHDLYVKKFIQPIDGSKFFKKEKKQIARLIDDKFLAAERTKRIFGDALASIPAKSEDEVKLKCLPYCNGLKSCRAVEYQNGKCTFYDKLKYGDYSLEDAPKNEDAIWIKNNYMKHTGKDRPNGDIDSIENIKNINDLSSCVNKCNMNEQCVGFGYASNKKLCSLKMSNADGLSDNIAVDYYEKSSGAKNMNPITNTQIGNYNIIGDKDSYGRQIGANLKIITDMTKRNGDGWGYCIAKCNANPKCKYVVVNWENSKCSLKEANNDSLKDNKDRKAWNLLSRDINDRKGWNLLTKKDWTDYPLTLDGISTTAFLPIYNIKKKGADYGPCDKKCKEEEKCSSYVAETKDNGSCWFNDSNQTPQVIYNGNMIAKLKPQTTIQNGKYVVVK